MSCLSPSGTLPGADIESLKTQLLEPLLRRRVVLASAHAVLALTLSTWQLVPFAREHNSGPASGKSSQTHPGQPGRGAPAGGPESHHPEAPRHLPPPGKGLQNPRNPHHTNMPPAPQVTREGYPAHQRPRSEPLPHRTNGIRWQSGGVSEDERGDLRRAASTYNLWLETALRGRGEYIANARITIWREPAHVAVLENQLDGPWLMVDLPPGRYSVEARWHPDGTGAEFIRRLNIQLGAQDHRRVTLHFPADAPTPNPPRPQPRP